MLTKIRCLRDCLMSILIDLKPTMLHPSKERPPENKLKNSKDVKLAHSQNCRPKMADFNSNFSLKYCQIEKQHWHNFPLTSWYLFDIENNEGKLVESEKFGQELIIWSEMEILIRIGGLLVGVVAKLGIVALGRTFINLKACLKNLKACFTKLQRSVCYI